MNNKKSMVFNHS